ncbi:hypothetical protein Tco_0917034 [Tanacetum coccineum]
MFVEELGSSDAREVRRGEVTMSSATSAVTYTSVYTDSEPGRAFWGADDEEAFISLPPEAEVERLLAMTTPSPSPPISLSPPSAGERLTRITSTQALIDAVTTVLPSPPLPPLPPSLYIPPPVDRRDDIPESEQPPLGVPIQEELMALRFRIDIAEAEIASLRARNKTTEAIEKITRNRERQAREKMERQLGLIQEELESLRRSRLP